MSPAFFAAALVHGLRGDEEEHTRWIELGESISRKSEGKSACRAYFQSRVALHHGLLEQAWTLAMIPDSYDPYYFPYVQAVRVETAVLVKLPDAEEQLAAAQRLVKENDFLAAQLLRATGRLHSDETALEDSVAGWEAIGARFERACTLLLLADRVDEGRAELAAIGCVPPGHAWS